jgi:bifunctional DNA-binding transcriptional regulator/antitoxin component of YhaV-PrlF toxin-antitoxin module
MTTRNVTVTSKNQITLPIEYVRALQLSQSRVLEVKIQDGRIILSPQPALSDTMKQFWGKHSAKAALSGADLKQAVRRSAAERAAKAQ